VTFEEYTRHRIWITGTHLALWRAPYVTDIVRRWDLNLWARNQ
jgi:hypothetical protein